MAQWPTGSRVPKRIAVAEIKTERSLSLNSGNIDSNNEDTSVKL